MMRKIFSILSCSLLMLTMSYSLADAIYFKGGAGDGWSMFQRSPVMYQGGNGKGEGTAQTPSAILAYPAKNTTVTIDTSPIYAGKPFQVTVRLMDDSTPPAVATNTLKTVTLQIKIGTGAGGSQILGTVS